MEAETPEILGTQKTSEACVTLNPTTSIFLGEWWVVILLDFHTPAIPWDGKNEATRRHGNPMALEKKHA